MNAKQKAKQEAIPCTYAVVELNEQTTIVPLTKATWGEAQSHAMRIANDRSAPVRLFTEQRSGVRQKFTVIPESWLMPACAKEC